MSGAPDPVHDVAALPRSVIDIEVFEQLLEMDEDDYEFSQSLVNNFFEQAEATFDKMQSALSSDALEEVSTLAHFLKGSSAAIGVIKVRDSCEIMQHFGSCVDADGTTQLTQEEAKNKLVKIMAHVQPQYREAESTLRAFFGA